MVRTVAPAACGSARLNYAGEETEGQRRECRCSTRLDQSRGSLQVLAWLERSRCRKN